MGAHGTLRSAINNAQERPRGAVLRAHSNGEPPPTARERPRLETPPRAALPRRPRGAAGDCEGPHSVRTPQRRPAAPLRSAPRPSRPGRSSPSSSSFTSLAAFSPSSRKLRSIILLRSTAALSSALSVQPMAAAGRRPPGRDRAGTEREEPRRSGAEPRLSLSRGGSRRRRRISARRDRYPRGTPGSAARARPAGNGASASVQRRMTGAEVVRQFRHGTAVHDGSWEERVTSASAQQCPTGRRGARGTSASVQRGVMGVVVLR